MFVYNWLGRVSESLQVHLKSDFLKSYPASGRYFLICNCRWKHIQSRSISARWTYSYWTTRGLPESVIHYWRWHTASISTTRPADEERIRSAARILHSRRNEHSSDADGTGESSWSVYLTTGAWWPGWEHRPAGCQRRSARSERNWRDWQNTWSSMRLAVYW